MFELAPQIITYIIWAIFFGGITLYLLTKPNKNREDQCHPSRTNSHELHIDQLEKKTSSVTTQEDNSIKPLLLKEPREGGKDNLQLIKGVGKVLEGVLNDTGIYHFDQIANLTEEEIAWLDKSISFPGRIKREQWVEQAKQLAQGIETEFSQRVERGEVNTSKKSED